MSRILKTLGLAAAVVAALVAMMAPAAQAEPGLLTTAGFPSIVTAQQQGGPTFDIGDPWQQTVTCASNLDATLVAPTNPVTFRPTYNNCISDPAQTPVTVTMNGCDYQLGFTRPGTTGAPITTGTIQARINCPAGQQIQIHVYENAAQHAANVSKCTYDIPPQGPVPAGVYHNTMAGIPDVDLTLNARFTAISTIGAGMFPCGGNPLTGHLPITLTGTYTMRGFQDIQGVEGAQIPVDVG